MPSYTLYYFNGRGRAEICRMLFAAGGVQYTDKRFEFNEWDRYRKDMPCMCLPVLEIDNRYKMPETMSISRYLAREFGFYGRNNMEMFRIDYICDCFYEIMHDYMRYFHWKNGRFRGAYIKYDPNNVAGVSILLVTSTVVPRIERINKISKVTTSTFDSSSNHLQHHHGSSLGCMGAKMSSCISSSTSTPTMEYSWTDMQMMYMESCRRILPFLERSLEMRNEGCMYYMGEQMMLCDIMCYCCLENPLMENNNLLCNYPKLVSLRNRVASHPKISMYLKRRCNTMW